MDGYAVRAADVASVPVTLAVAGAVPAGGFYEATLQPGQAVRIFTGAPLPAGADAIVIQEDTEASPGKVLVKEAAKPGQFVRPAGLDFRAGDIGIKAGRRMTARDVGLAAAMNVPWLKVHRRPRVAILATGDEVVMPGTPIGRSQIVCSNGISLAATIEAVGGAPIDLGIAPDNREALLAMADGARGADLLVTTGGASVGEHDLVQAVLGEAGLAVDFWKIAMRPGKPLIFGTIHGVPMLGLPGNPGLDAGLLGDLFGAGPGEDAGPRPPPTRPRATPPSPSRSAPTTAARTICAPRSATARTARCWRRRSPSRTARCSPPWRMPTAWSSARPWRRRRRSATASRSCRSPAARAGFSPSNPRRR